MSITEQSYDKAHEHNRTFDALPSVLIHDPAREASYFLSPESLQEHQATPDTWAKLDDSTVTFVIPNGELIDEVPSFLRTPELKPSVLIRYSQEQAAYFLTFDDLQRHAVAEAPTLDTSSSISFIIPRGTELIEELPALRRALLQSNTQ